MTPAERRILINQRTIMRALYRVLAQTARAPGNQEWYVEINEDIDATIKLLKDSK